MKKLNWEPFRGSLTGLGHSLVIQKEVLEQDYFHQPAQDKNLKDWDRVVQTESLVSCNQWSDGQSFARVHDCARDCARDCANDRVHSCVHDHALG